MTDAAQRLDSLTHNLYNLLTLTNTDSAFLNALADSRCQVQASNISGLWVQTPLENMNPNTSSGLALMEAYLSQIEQSLGSLLASFTSLMLLIQLSNSLSSPPSLPPLGYSCSTQEIYLQ